MFYFVFASLNALSIGRKADELRIEVAVASQENTVWPSDISRRVRASKVRHMQARDEFGPVMVWW